MTEPKIEIVNRQRHCPVDRERMRHAARIAFARGSGSGDGLTILLAGDRKLRELNRRYRGKDRTTDVLSFPSGERTPAGDVHVGDIAISTREAMRQAGDEGVSAGQVLDRLVVHGVLHLLGYDHEVDDGEMMKLQASVLRGLEAGVAP